MRILVALLLFTLFQAPALAGERGWAFSTRLSGAGPLCVASVEQGGVTAGFYALPLGPTYAFIKGVSLPRNARSTWQVGGYEWRQFTGASDAYSGFHSYPGIPPNFLHEVAAGSRLNLYLHDSGLAGNAPITGTFDISLRGSARSISAFLACQAGQPRLVFQARIVVETYGYMMPGRPIPRY